MGTVMNTSRYRQLLAAFNEQVSSCDSQAGRLTNQWLHSFDVLTSAAPTRFMLTSHMSRVRRSATAIEILAREQGTLPAVAGAREVLEATAADLLSEIERLQKEARHINEVLADRGLEMIVGESMSSVEFAMDSIQLRFNGSALTSFVSLQVHDHGQIFQETQPGYSDAICALIGAAVTGTEVREGDVLRITFADDRSITVSLRAEDAVGPECAYFVSDSGRWWFW
jgi:hypothetical protein